ncbi:hypothetical protein RHMOL_Rhmol04G0179400 [Rhododendron molle]|uniref:Uncharacterized protein n=1 Tax=Rhododendron molle TaxID=49168 RepID=A0ACC0P1T0_RHOML|nr:hypothetical protein RHMOL_Rhmol04G0179400 [Rhododendron molle]
MDLDKDVEDLRKQILHVKRGREWFVMMINCMNRKIKEMEDGITVKMEERKNKENLNALEIEEVKT